jgi:uncharacterized protein YhbP (UPF0306 family)
MGVKEMAAEHIKKHNIASIATCSNDVPYASTVEYASDGFVLYFSTNPNSQKAKNLANNSKVSLTINEDIKDWTKIKGIQLEGTAVQLASEEEVRKAKNIYVEKFPFVVHFPPSPNKMYKVVPKRIMYLDYEKGFGQREIIDFP